jgi:Asp-tRNA(Asn)/Glu-tRNA(Gln) amidotransferase A subunit family amidase
MIRVAAKRATDFRDVEMDIASARTLGELIERYEGRIDRYLRLNEQYMFSESFDRDFVLRQVTASWSRRDAELFCIPFGVKDVFNTKVLPTAMGSEIWKGFKAGNNARIVDELVARGGIVFSKTTTAEFAVHYIQAGKTLNPHDRGRITGTSSAGSAVAIACGALPICLGTQTGGSIVRPASFCGVYGFKPSFGAFDRTGTLKTADTLDTIGLLGSDIYGIRKAFTAAFQKNPQYPFAIKYFDALAAHRRKSKVRVGIFDSQFAGYAAYDSSVREDFDDAAQMLRAAGIELSRIDGVDFINEIHGLHQIIYNKALSYYFQQEAQNGAGISPIMRKMIDTGSATSPHEYLQALQRQSVLRSRFDTAFADFDFLITPSTASPAPLLGEEERDDTCLIWTFLGYPVVSIPAFVSPELGIPYGLQIVAPKYGDLALLDFADQVVAELQSGQA